MPLSIKVNTMADEEAQIRELQLSRARTKASSSTQREAKDVALSASNASMSEDIYGKSSGSRFEGYNTEIDAGGGPDEDIDMEDAPQRMLDSCKFLLSAIYIHLSGWTV